ncbi:MAG: uroporphyrinogen decarboxylase family protein [Chloroflexota bacterium]
MTPRQRFLTALSGKTPDRVPVWDWVNNPALYQDRLGEKPYFFDGRLAARLSRSLGLDAAWAPAEGFMGLISPRWTWIDPSNYRDEWGIGYRVEAGSWPLAFPAVHPVSNRADWDRLTPPPAGAPWRARYARAAVEEARGAAEAEIAIVGGLRGPFSSTWLLMGLLQMSFCLYDDSGLLTEIFQTMADFWIEIGLTLVAAGVDALVIHDDLGSNDATFFPPDTLRQLYLPHLRRQVQTLAAAGRPVILHSCGNINAVLPDLVATGIAGLNNLQRAARMDIEAVKAAYGPALCLIGNVDATNLMPTATPAEVEQAVRDCLRLGAPGGGYILATDHSFHEGIPLENVYAFIKAGQRYGAY